MMKCPNCKKNSLKYSREDIMTCVKCGYQTPPVNELLGVKEKKE